MAIPFSLVRDSLRTWSPFPLSASHLRFQVREKSRTSEPRPTSRLSEWPSHSPWCAIPFAPGVRSRCRPVTCASRCVRKVAPRSPAPHPDPLSGHPVLPGARFPSHLESVPAVGQSLALPGAREKSHLGAPPRVPVLRVAFPLFQVRDSSSHLESVPAVGQSLALPGAREKSHLGAPPRVPVLRVAFPLFQVRDSSSHLESVPAVGQSLALPGAREESHLGAPPRVPVLRVAFPFFQVRDSPSHLDPEMADIQ